MGFDDSPPDLLRSADNKTAESSDHEGETQRGHTGHAGHTVVAAPRGWSAWFGGPNVTVGPRIGPVLDSISLGGLSDSDESSSAILDKQIALESGAAIQYRTCSWQKVCIVVHWRNTLVPAALIANQPHSV